MTTKNPPKQASFNSGKEKSPPQRMTNQKKNETRVSTDREKIEQNKQNKNKKVNKAPSVKVVKRRHIELL